MKLLSLIFALVILFVSIVDTKAVKMTRTISKGLAPVVERFELDRPQIVTLRDIEKICAEEGIGSEPRLVASRLKKVGWLLPVGKRGVWEFAPAELAGPYSSYDPLLPVKAIVATGASGNLLLRGQTAAWAMGLADRVPSSVEVVISSNVHGALPESVSACMYRTALPPKKVKGVLSLAPEAVLVQMIERPSSVRSWASAAEWLPDVMAEMDAKTTLVELQGKPVATVQRAGYLLQSARPDIAEAIFETQRPKNVARFGRGATLRSSSKWMVADALLPWDPHELERVA